MALANILLSMVSRASLIYSADFSVPLSLQFEADLLDAGGEHRVRTPTSAWVLESQSNASRAYTTASGNLVMENKGSHMVLWANRKFPASGEVRFGVMPANTSVGLNIVFFATLPLRNETRFANATSIFDLSLPPRKGDYPNYHGGPDGKGSILGYSLSYWRAGNGTQPCDRDPHDGRCTANLRKNPGFSMVSQGDDLVLGRAPRNGVAFEIVLRREGPVVSVTVDGAISLEWSDDGRMSPPFGGGYVGLRQMSTTRVGTYTHFDVNGIDGGHTSASTNDRSWSVKQNKGGPHTKPLPPSSFQARCAEALAVHVSKPFPAVHTDDRGFSWAISNLALARLALHGSTNSTVAMQVSAEIAAYQAMPSFTPWNNYTVDGPLAGLGALPVLVRLALLPRLRCLLTEDAIASLETIMFRWLSPRSNAVWASSSDSWRVVDGSENLDATRKASLYLAALVVNRTAPDKVVALDGKPVSAHASAWETHWRAYFINRANEGIGVEFGSPTYAKYALQNFINIADLSSSAALRRTAGDFLQLWFADAAQAFLPSTGQRGGAHNRVYRTAAFFSPDSSFAGFTYLYGWWNASSPNELENALSTPQTTLFATSTWEPLPIVSAMATMAEGTPPNGLLYTSRRLGDREACTAPLGPHCRAQPCKICTVCGKVPAFIGDTCATLKTTPTTTVVKEEFVAPSKRYTLGAIRLDVGSAARHNSKTNTSDSHEGAGSEYVAGVIQNHQVGAFLGGANPAQSRVLFGDSGSTNCSDTAFQRHSYESITSSLVRGAIVVARPANAKINGCTICKNHSLLGVQSEGGDLGNAPCSPPGTCMDENFPLWLFVSSDLYASRTDITATGPTSQAKTYWSCFNGADETFGCAALSGPTSFVPSPCISPAAPSSLAYWNGTLLAFNGSKTSTDFGVLQMGSGEKYGSFADFLQAMRRQVVTVDPETGAMTYVALSGDTLRMGQYGAVVPAFAPLRLTFDSPFVRAEHRGTASAEPFVVQLRFPGFANQTLHF